MARSLFLFSENENPCPDICALVVVVKSLKCRQATKVVVCIYRVFHRRMLIRILRFKYH